jgi:hypothetical protein
MLRRPNLLTAKRRHLLRRRRRAQALTLPRPRRPALA